ncbi:MAG: hypothetical protein U0271_04505 [Polyangiaceae bacterium]
MTQTELPWVPPGSDQIAFYARSRRLLYEARPQEEWFRRWEPHDTLVSPEFWFNAVSVPGPWGVAVAAEAWTAGERIMPIERALVVFVEWRGAPSYGPRGALRVGEPFLTKTMFLEKPPPPKIEIGDPIWDQHVTTFALTFEDALAAFPKRLREYLRTQGFRGHLEVRPYGFVLHPESCMPRPDHYELAFRMASDVAYALRTP